METTVRKTQTYVLASRADPNFVTVSSIWANEAKDEALLLLPSTNKRQVTLQGMDLSVLMTSML